jgi:hypothetical protein
VHELVFNMCDSNMHGKRIKTEINTSHLFVFESGTRNFILDLSQQPQLGLSHLIFEVSYLRNIHPIANRYTDLSVSDHLIWGARD